MTQVPPAPRPPLVRRPQFWLILAAALLGVALAVIIGVALGGATGSSDAGATPAPSATAKSQASDVATLPTTTDAPGTDAPPAPRAVVIPASCADIYTRDWTTRLGGLVLNPAWTEEPGNGPFWGSNDIGAITMLEATSGLTCAWVGANGGGDLGLITNIASLTPDQQASMIEYLGGAGHSCYEELDGTRCVIEWNSDAGDSGESHFFRDGIWSATRWANVNADGYTHDIVAAIFG